MKFLVKEKELPGKTKEDFEPFLKLEAQKVWEYYNLGFIREIYFTKESHEAVLIIECDTKQRVKEKLNGLPLVKEGLIEFDIEELVPYNGFERLFSQK